MPASSDRPLYELWEAGRAAWPGIDLAPAVFLEHLRRHAAGAEKERLRQTQHPGDLYLACACAQGDQRALQAFDLYVLSEVPVLLARARPSPTQVEEVTQLLREKLFVGAAPKILHYSGRGPLRGWLRVAALRTLLNLRSPQRERRERTDDEDALLMVADGQSPELDYLQGRYRAAFRQALREALAALPADQRGLLRMYFIESLPMERIAALLKLHRSTVSRWLSATYETLLGEVRRLLGERLNLAPAEFEELARVLRSQLDVSLSALDDPAASPGDAEAGA